MRSVRSDWNICGERHTMKKRYNTANDIRAAIDFYRVKAQKLKDSAAAMDIRAEEFQKAGPAFKFDIDYCRGQADKKRKSANRIEEKQMVKLKNKLSEWMTPQLPGVDNGDRSIPVQ